MTVPALRNRVRDILTRSGVDHPDGDTREILSAALERPYTELMLRDGEASQYACEKAIKMARRRADGEPLQYVLGFWFFMGQKYLVGEGVLIPRDDTEVVVTEAIKLMRDTPAPAIVDLCAGSGIIAITLAHKLHTTAYAVEKSEAAFRYLKENIALRQADVKAILSDLSDCADSFADGSIDLIVSNPPYIPAKEIPTLQSEVQYEPRLALDGGEDGCDFYRTIIRLWTNKLKDGGCIAFEIGEDQFETIAEMLKDAGYADIQGTPDIMGTIRAVTARSACAL